MEKKVKTERKVTGKHIITGEDVVKDVEVKTVKPVALEGREKFKVIKDLNGSLQFRTFKHKAGEEVDLNVDEAALFKDYVQKV